MKRIKKAFIYGLLTVVVSLTSCNESVLDLKDLNQFNTATYFNTPEEIQQGVNGAYHALFLNSMLQWRYYEMYDALANEFEPTPASLSNEANIVQFWHYEYNNGSNVISGLWQDLYAMILRANLVIEKSTNYIEKNGDDPLVDQSMGEAYFLRGWAYSQLAFHWGRVPIRITYDQSDNIDAPRADNVSEVWAVAESDFKLAQQLLPATYDAANLGRATSGAATAFLGKLYLYNKEYDKADLEFAKLDNGNYALLPGNRWDDNFGEVNENNEESIFEWQLNFEAGDNKGAVWGSTEKRPNPGTNMLRPQLYSWNLWANWKFQPRRVADFQYKDETGADYVDPRAALTFYGGIGDNTWLDESPDGPRPYDFATNGYWYRKGTNREIKETENNTESGNNLRVMRYADVILMRAECKILTTKVAEGIDFINEVRRRIGAFEYTKGYSQDEAFNLLKRERQLEFMGEGMRYNDLVRWGILEETMNPETMALFGKNTVTNKHYLFPIPLTEIDSNPGFGDVSGDWN